MGAAVAPRSITSVNMQAAIIAYVNDFKLLMILALAAMALVLLLRKGGDQKPDDHAAAAVG